MTDFVQRALDYVRLRCPQGPVDVRLPVTINFHPDLMMDGSLVIDRLGAEGVYRSQFETGTSNGGLTAFQGGDRWLWESRIFGGAYDKADPSLRPKYGSLNYRNDPVGGSRRFGSAHFRLHPHVRERISFSYPDSHLGPDDFAVDDVCELIALAEMNPLALDPWLDNYIEAHIHGPLVISEDVETLVLDPSFKDSRIEDAARSLGCRVDWHEGFRLSVDRLAECRTYRGQEAADGIIRIAENGSLTPARLWRARGTELDYQIAKWVWHCVARCGYE